MISHIWYLVSTFYKNELILPIYNFFSVHASIPVWSLTASFIFLIILYLLYYSLSIFCQYSFGLLFLTVSIFIYVYFLQIRKLHIFHCFINWNLYIFGIIKISVSPQYLKLWRGTLLSVSRAPFMQLFSKLLTNSNFEM